MKDSNLASVGLLSTMLKPKLWIWGKCQVSQIFMSNYFQSKILRKIQILHQSAYWAPCWSLSYEFEDDAVFPRFLCRLMQALRTEVFLGWFLLIILFFFLFFPPHHNRKKNRRQCKDMDNCLVQFVPFKNILNNTLDNFWWSRVQQPISKLRILDFQTFK